MGPSNWGPQARLFGAGFGIPIQGHVLGPEGALSKWASQISPMFVGVSGKHEQMKRRVYKNDNDDRQRGRNKVSQVRAPILTPQFPMLRGVLELPQERTRDNSSWAWRQNIDVGEPRSTDETVNLLKSAGNSKMSTPLTVWEPQNENSFSCLLFSKQFLVC